MGPRLRLAVWTATILTVVALASLPIGLDAQLLLGISCIAGMGLLLFSARDGLPKHIFLALGTFVVLRYVYWRTSSTLPPVGLTGDFIFGFVLYLAEMYCVFVLALSLFIMADPVPSRSAPQMTDGDLPNVDVFVPSYNEDASLLYSTALFNGAWFGELHRHAQSLADRPIRSPRLREVVATWGAVAA